MILHGIAQVLFRITIVIHYLLFHQQSQTYEIAKWVH